MENRKDIGNAFNEKLSTLNKSPREQVWIGIQEELDKKKKRRGFIFWFLFTAVAIGTVTSFIYLSDFKSGKPSNNKSVTTESNAANENNSHSTKTGATSTDVNKINSGSTEPENADLNNSEGKENGKMTNNEVATSENEESGNVNLNKKTGLGHVKNSKTASANAKSGRKNGTSFNASDNLKNSNSAYSKKSKKSKYKKAGNFSENDGSLHAENNKAGKNPKKKSNTTIQSDQEAISSTNSEIKKSDDLDQSKQSGNSTNTDALKLEKSKALTPLEERKRRLEEMKQTALKKRDSIVAARKEEKKKIDPVQNPTDEQPKDSTKTETAKSGYEITVAPYYGYNYTGNFGNGNFINDSKTSKKTSEFNSSYGVLIRIMGSSKMGMQVGVGFINSVYSTDFTKESNSFINENDLSLSIPLADINELFPNQSKVTSRQETTFIEVPLEGYYILSDKKFGLATSFGISFLKLQKNGVFFESESTERMKIGKLENISPFSSSVNAKFHLFYKIAPKLYFDLYPSFQYQFMGYKGVSNYHPYFFSIKTGLSYKL